VLISWPHQSASLFDSSLLISAPFHGFVTGGKIWSIAQGFVAPPSRKYAVIVSIDFYKSESVTVEQT
jgi:hypothetical protein